ncbi:amidase [Embleya sp. NPDC001921]
MTTAHEVEPTICGYFTNHTLADLADALRARHVTAVELAHHALDAITGLNDRLHAFVAVDAVGALRAAERADRELHAGRDRGALHGIPVAVKDLIDVAGLPATYGSAHFRDHVPAVDAACVTGLREAGAVIVGKTTTHEFAYGATGDRSLQGASRNPHDPSRMTGGSSGGSAAAVAAGMVPLALGTDTGGSVRIPSALCGVHGFKPAFGALPTEGVFPLATAFDHVGIHARGARDCLIAYHALVGAVPEPARVATPLRIAWLDTSGLGPTDPRVARSARAALEQRVGPVPEISFPGAARLRQAFLAIQGRQAHTVHADRIARDPGLFDPEVLQRLRGAGAVGDDEVAHAHRVRDSAVRTVAGLFEEHDVLALPTVPVVAPLLGRRDLDVAGTPVEVRMLLLSLTFPWNLVGVPALTLPAAPVDGLPAGLQLVAPKGREHILFHIADLPARVEATTLSSG